MTFSYLSFEIFRRRNIEIDEVSGTSIGVIIASMIAILMNSNEIHKFTNELNMLKLVDPDLKSWFLKGEKLLQKQAKGKKKMKQFGKVSLPSEAFVNLLKK